jgi:hypothetical protein
MAPTRHRRSSPGGAPYDPTISAEDPAARPAVRLLDLLLQVSLDAGHTSLKFVLEDREMGLVTANANGTSRVLLRSPADAIQAFIERLRELAEWSRDTSSQVGFIHIKQGSQPLALRLTIGPSPLGLESATLELGWDEGTADSDDQEA